MLHKAETACCDVDYREHSLKFNMYGSERVIVIAYAKRGLSRSLGNVLPELYLFNRYSLEYLALTLYRTWRYSV